MKLKFDKNLASIHAYLCADGYVIKNPKTQKQKYYYIGFRNTNLILLKDFQKRFLEYFGVKPRLIEGQRCVIQNKEVYNRLINQFVSFYSHEWKMPLINKKLSRLWLKAFFDCEGWVFCKSHQNRHIGLDSVNEKGLDQIIQILNNLGIRTIKKINKKRKMFRIFIYGKENLKKFEKEIGFLHPEKFKKLKITLNDFMHYNWNVNKNNIIKIIKEKAKIKKPFYVRIISKKEINLKDIARLLKKLYNINCIMHKRTNGFGTIYYELNINKREYIKKLIKLKIIPNILKNV